MGSDVNSPARSKSEPRACNPGRRPGLNINDRDGHSMCNPAINGRARFYKEVACRRNLGGVTCQWRLFVLYWLRAGCSSVWLERLVRDQEVAGSSPVTPIFNHGLTRIFTVF